MKKIFLLTVISLSTLILLSSFEISRNIIDEDTEELVFPENIDNILQKSCFGCHNSNSKNTKAKLKLKLDQLGSMKISKQVSKLSKIAKEVEKGDMPSKKFLSHYPEKALTDDEKTTLITWARSTAENLANGK